MKKNVLIFDLDHTLFDTARFRKNSFRAIASLGISEKIANKLAVAAFVHQQFHHKKLAHLLSEDTRMRKKIVAEFDALLGQSDDYWYDDAKALLTNLKKKFCLVLLSYGNKNYQMRKISPSFAKFFDAIHITQEKSKATHLKRLQKKHASVGTLFLDDSLIALESAKALGMKAIKIKIGKKEPSYFAKLEKRINAYFSSL